ncbi:hypothetical protein GS530_06515 [Rhodococcus hoagii]|nr:hypothetical protein [Prescottella equi]
MDRGHRRPRCHHVDIRASAHSPVGARDGRPDPRGEGRHEPHRGGRPGRRGRRLRRPELGELQSVSTGWPTLSAGAGTDSATFSGGTWATTSRRQRSSSPRVWAAKRREVAIFFVDLVGSTELAATRPPGRSSTLLNRFFEVVVDEVDRHVGSSTSSKATRRSPSSAPRDLDDAAGHALAAARMIRRRLLAEVPECCAAIGFAAGTAVAGNVGARERFEYTVIGDPVNEAARLSEIAKTNPAVCWHR